jgi:hypothetical protein
MAEEVLLCRLADGVVGNDQALVRSDTIRNRFEPAAKAHMGLFEGAPPSCRRTREPRVLQPAPPRPHTGHRQQPLCRLLKSSAFHTGSAAHDKNDCIIYNKKTGALYYDADGTGTSNQV